jgi:transglutaminase-like putative cysteine protease
MRYKVWHLTKIAYAIPVAHARLNLRLAPWPFMGQVLVGHRLELSVQPATRDELAGPYCVNTTRLAFGGPLASLEVISEFVIDVMPGAEPGEGPPVPQVAEEALLRRDLSVTAPAPYLFGSHIAVLDEQIGAWAQHHFDADAGIVAAASRLMGVIYRDFEYAKGATNTATPPADAFAQRQGVCQDFAHIMIMALRSLGIPAAYASGYLLTQPPPGKKRLVGADAMHAWVNVWCGEELGWIGFDPTNNRLAREQHIQIAMGRDYADVAPIDGIFIGSAPQKMTTAVDVQPI